MRTQPGSQPHRRVWLSVLASLIPFLLILHSPIAGSAGQHQSTQRSELGLEISLPGSERPLLRLAGPHGGGGMTLIRRDMLRIIDPIAAGNFTALDVQAAVESDTMRVTLSLIYNDITNQEWWKDKKERSVGSYLIHDGETARPANLAEFGIEPFDMKVIGAKPISFKPGEGPRIINNTTALQVERLEKHLDFYSISLKNTSSKDVVVYTVSSGDGGATTSGLGTVSPVIAAGATSRETLMSSSNVERSGITISLVIFIDGTFEGDSKIATKFLALGEGVRIQAPHVLGMIEQTLKVDDSDIRSAFDKLEAELWVIPEAMSKPVALQFLKEKFPDQDEKALSALYEDFKGGLYDARNIALSSIGQTRRQVVDLEEHSQFASAVGSIRGTLEHLRETLGKITSGPR
jgi:hypothetical protein